MKANKVRILNIGRGNTVNVNQSSEVKMSDIKGSRTIMRQSYTMIGMHRSKRLSWWKRFWLRLFGKSPDYTKGNYD